MYTGATYQINTPKDTTGFLLIFYLNALCGFRTLHIALAPLGVFILKLNICPAQFPTNLLTASLEELLVYYAGTNLPGHTSPVASPAGRHGSLEARQG